MPHHDKQEPRCQHPHLSWDILFYKAVCPTCGMFFVPRESAPSAVVGSERAAFGAGVKWEREMASVNPSHVAPIDMLLFCPRCGMQHVDAPEPEIGWTNPPHATHTCKGCGLNWRPSNALTNGAGDLPAAEAKHLERMKASDPLLYARSASGDSELPDAACKALVHDMKKDET